MDLSEQLGIIIPEILLPDLAADINNWPVIACDQYTSSPEYWDGVRNRVESGNNISSYNLILPEIYLEHPGSISVENRIAAISATMNDYLAKGYLKSCGRCIVLTDRSTPLSPSRKGLVFAIDLETYEFSEGSTANIRATEGTVIERIPPRLQIRSSAAIELPHVMILADDPNCTIIEPLSLAAERGDYETLYDTDLPEGGGHIKGYKIPDGDIGISAALTAMSKLRSYIESGLLFAVGDGNHSLASAKTHWNNIRDNVSKDHPARYAMVELINIHDKSLTFEPIHRMLFGPSPTEFITAAPFLLPESAITVSSEMSFDNARVMAQTIESSVQPFVVFNNANAVVVTFNNPPSFMTAGSVQILIDKFVEFNSGASVDYIHGIEQLVPLSSQGCGIILPPLSKDTFFEMIATHGVLPRKSFSMGEAYEKRYYMECRKIR